MHDNQDHPRVQGLPPNVNLPPNGFVRLPTILALIPISKSSLWEMVRRGDFPRPVKLSSRVTAWRNEDIRAFIEGL